MKLVFIVVSHLIIAFYPLKVNWGVCDYYTGSISPTASLIELAEWNKNCEEEGSEESYSEVRKLSK